jgi:hypothetical protein
MPVSRQTVRHPHDNFDRERTIGGTMNASSMPEVFCGVIGHGRRAVDAESGEIRLDTRPCDESLPAMVRTAASSRYFRI